MLRCITSVAFALLLNAVFADSALASLPRHTDGDLTGLSHDLASLTAPVTFSFTNDGAGRLTSESISDPAWMWKPVAERIVTYAPTNTLGDL